MIARQNRYYDLATVVVVIGGVRYTVHSGTALTGTDSVVTAQLEPSDETWAGTRAIRPWDHPVTEPKPAPLRDPFFPDLARATPPQHRPKQAPARPAYVRAYQRHREARTKPQRSAVESGHATKQTKR